MRAQRLSLLVVGLALAAVPIGLDAVGGTSFVLLAAPALMLLGALAFGVYPGEETLARLRDRRRLTPRRPRPARMLRPLVVAVAVPAGAYRRALPRRGPPRRLAPA